MYRPKASRLQRQPLPFQPKTAPTPPTPKHPAAPPVYRPQTAPQALQAKTVSPKVNPPASQSRHSPVAPPVYRPAQAKLAQPKMAAQSPAAQPARTTPKAPPVYRPQAAPRVLQSKQANVRTAPAPLACRSQQIPKVAQAKTMPGQKLAGGPRTQSVSGSISSPRQFTIQMVPVTIGRQTYDTKYNSHTRTIEQLLNEKFRTNPNSSDLNTIYQSLMQIDDATIGDADELDNTIFIRDTLLGGMRQTDSGYREQMRTLQLNEWQSASCRIYVDDRELDYLSWRRVGTPGGELDYQGKQEKGKEDKQSAKNFADGDGFQTKLTKGAKRDIQISVEDAESKVIAKVESAMRTPSFLNGLHRAQHSVYIRFVSYLGACNACKTRIQILLQTIRAEVPAGIPVSLSFFYQDKPRPKVRGRGIRTYYGWAEDVASTERGFGGLYIHDYPTVTGTWVAPVVVSSASSSSSAGASLS
jgi:hypothetical protein